MTKELEIRNKFLKSSKDKYWEKLLLNLRREERNNYEFHRYLGKVYINWMIIPTHSKEGYQYWEDIDKELRIQIQQKTK